ncbi:MAG: hypothetical protein C0595_01840 [Marinilabiliales bacterium]|nr:MAG: hypothetical protein C0595_01840 [Marinilabiliales bacterium]
MRKFILFTLSILISGIVVSQQAYQFKIDTKTMKEIENPEQGIEPVKAPIITKSDIKSKPITPPADRDANIVTVVSLGTVANAYGWGYAGGQQSLIPVNQDLNTIAVVHRMGGNDDPGGYSGDLGYDVSFDGGLTWSTMNEFYIASENEGGEYFLDAARYPNAGFVDASLAGKGLEDSYFTYFAPNLWGLNDIWGGYSYGVVNLTDTSYHTKNIYIEEDYYLGVPSAFFQKPNGDAFSLDIDYDLTSSTYNDQLIYIKGQWDSGLEDMVYTFDGLDAPMDVSGYPVDEKVAFSPDGMTGYISVLGNDGNAEQMSGYSNVYPIYWKTTDGGETWEGPNFIQLDGPNGIGGIVYHHLTDQLIADLFEPPVPAREDISYTTAFDHDVSVDNNGNLHIAVMIGPTGADPQSIITAKGYLAAIDLFTTDGGTTWFAEEMGRPSTFRGTFGDITEDNRIRITTNWEGNRIFISWLDTDIEDAEDNDRPNLWVRGFNPSSYMKTENSSGEDGPTNVTLFSEGMWQSYFGNASKYCFTNENGYNIPFVYEDMDPADPLAPLTLKYIQDFYFTESQFTIIGVNENKVVKEMAVVSQNYPNPFKGESYVNIHLNNDTYVSMNIMSVTGQLVSSKDYGYQTSGSHTLRIDANNLPQGVYFYTIIAGESKYTKKMIVE